jgi:hypothetical protein
MLLNSDYYTPTTLSQYVREALLNLPVNQASLARWRVSPAARV